MKSLKYIFWPILGILVTYNISCFSQDPTGELPPSKENALSINLAGTTPFIGVSYERLLSDKINIEAGLGVFSAGIALKYFPFSIVDNKMVVDLVLGSNVFATPFDTFGSSDFSSISFLLIGLSYFGKEGFNFGLGIGPSINYDFEFNEISQPIYGNLKLGYRF